MTLQRLEELRRTAKERPLFFQETDELLAAAEEGLAMLPVVEHLHGRRVMEPKHSREDHECKECDALSELKRIRVQRAISHE